jgi:hypothetical protein
VHAGRGDVDEHLPLAGHGVRDLLVAQRFRRPELVLPDRLHVVLLAGADLVDGTLRVEVRSRSMDLAGGGAGWRA